MFKDSFKLTGRLVVSKYDDKNNLVFRTEVPNLVVTSGKQFIASRLASDSSPVMNYMAIGSDPTTAALAQTSLVNESARQLCTSATPSEVNTTFVATFGPGAGTGSVNEAGIFNQSSAAVLVFDGASAVASNQITYASHGRSTGDKVTYTAGGGTVVGGLVDGTVYYVIYVDTNNIKLATTYANAISGTFITLTDGIGSNHKLSYGDMLCRTTFPVISKSSSESLSISWIVTVG